MSEIAENYQRIRGSIPEDVTLVAATKERSAEEVEEVIEAGAEVIGENYTYPEAVQKYEELGEKADQIEWHLIGHLQKNDINKALPLFDAVQTVESLRKAKHIDKRVDRAGKDFQKVYIEVNSGREDSKYGIEPEFEGLRELLTGVEELTHLKVEGLMTMGPFTGDPDDARPYFQITRDLFRQAEKLDLANTEMNVLSMGMSNSYRVAIDEGANMVRVGTAIFGPRN